MVSIEFGTQNKAKSNAFPKLKLEKDEVARIVLLENPVMEFVHTLKAPQISNGKAQFEEKARKDGTKYSTNTLDFVSRFVCIGDEAILMDKASDPRNCPACALAAGTDYTAAPQRRFAMHVIKYGTENGTSKVRVPYSVDSVVWAFTDKVFNKISDFREEHGALDKHDLILKCENKDFQNYDISISGKAVWRENADDAKRTVETLKNNRATDLSFFCGSKKERQWIEEDVKKVRDAWAQAKGQTADDAGTPTAEVGGNLDAGLDDLLNLGAGAAAQSSFPAEDSSPSGSVSDDDDLLAGLLGNDSPAEETQAEEAPAASDDSGDNFDDLLKGL